MINFNNLERAFKDKSNKDLYRAYVLFLAIKNPYLTSFLTKILKIFIYLNIPLENIIKKTVYRHFCGGTDINECNNTINKLWKSNIGTILDFSAEGKESNDDFEKVYKQTILSINKAINNIKIPFAVFKATGLTSFNLLKKISLKVDLTESEKNQKIEFENRVNNICQTAHKNKVKVFIDAEESWIQEAIDEIVLKMMKKYNKNEIFIFNTIQCYRIDRLSYLKKIINNAKKEKYKIGVKIVRGAYHQKEIDRAIKKGYTIPVHESKLNTDKDFNRALEICIENIKMVSFCAGTHNEESTLYLLELMKKYNIENSNNHVYFSQLLGMSDHISYNLSFKKYNVSKYVPYGPVKDSLPYLIRRAEENTSISGQMNRELKNIMTEKKRRKI